MTPTSIFPGDVQWQDKPSVVTPVDTADLNQDKAAVKAYIDAGLPAAWVTATAYPTAGFAIGQQVSHGGQIYALVTAHTSGTFATDLATGDWLLVGTLPASVVSGSLNLVVDGAGASITTGLKGYLIAPFACTITGWTMIADQAGSAVVDIWKTSYAGAPPLVANTITGSALPTLSTAQKATSTTLTGWTVAVATGDVLAFNVNSAATVTKLSLSLAATKS
jgi:hypothetical protein